MPASGYSPPTPPTSTASDSGQTIPTEPITPISIPDGFEQTVLAQTGSQEPSPSGNGAVSLDELFARFMEETEVITPISIGPPSPTSSVGSISSSISVFPDVTTPADVTASLECHLPAEEHGPESGKSESPEAGSQLSGSTATQSDVPSVFSCQHGHSSLSTSQNTTPPAAEARRAGQSVVHVSHSEPLPYASYLGEFQLEHPSGAVQSPSGESRPQSEPPRNKRRFIFIEPLTQDCFPLRPSTTSGNNSGNAREISCQWRAPKRRCVEES